MKRHLYLGEVRLGTKADALCGERRKVRKVPNRPEDFIMCGGCWAAAHGLPVLITPALPRLASRDKKS